jgi:hypothetical protein
MGYTLEKRKTSRRRKRRKRRKKNGSLWSERVTYFSFCRFTSWPVGSPSHQEKKRTADKGRHKTSGTEIH